MRLPPTERRGGSNRPEQGRPRAFILVAVLIVVMLASMVVVSLLFRLRAEETALVAGGAGEQAWAAAMSGVYEAMHLAMQVAPGSLDWQDSPALFRERLVVDEGSDRWFFSVFAGHHADGSEEARFGLTDEASKLNINEATEEMFEKLPKMTPYLAQGLFDFLDTDDTPRPEGAEQEYYNALPRPYQAANGPLGTVEALLLVRGFTPALLYGEDANWNFCLDLNEDDGELQFPPDNKDGKLDQGLAAYLTVNSYDLNQDNARAPRLDLNLFKQAPAALGKSSSDELPSALITYLEALHRNQVKVEQPVDLLEAKGKFKDAEGKEVELESGVGKAELAVVLDQFTTSSERQFRGLLNVNTAPAAVLRTLPGIDEALADSIVAARRNLRPEQRRTPAWLYQEGLMDAGQLKKTLPYLTARAFQYRFHVVGYGLPSGRYRVLEAVIDTAGAKPVITYLRDITRLGLPFKIEFDRQSDASADPSGRLSRESAHLACCPEVSHG